jgi:hypothetical protein
MRWPQRDEERDRSSRGRTTLALMAQSRFSRTPVERVKCCGGVFLPTHVTSLKEGDELQDSAGLNGMEPILTCTALGYRARRVVWPRLSSSSVVKHIILFS